MEKSKELLCFGKFIPPPWKSFIVERHEIKCKNHDVPDVDSNIFTEFYVCDQIILISRLTKGDEDHISKVIKEGNGVLKYKQNQSRISTKVYFTKK